MTRARAYIRARHASRFPLRLCGTVRVRVPSLTAFVTAGALVAGCGGGSSATTFTSNADFVAQTNQICREDNAKFKALGTPSGSDVRPFLEKLIPLAEEDLSRLKGVSPPSDQAVTYDAWISELEQGTELSKKAQAASSPEAANNILEGSIAINKKADAKAKELGLDECLTGAGSGS